MNETEIIIEIQSIKKEFLDVAESLFISSKIDPYGDISLQAKRVINGLDEILKKIRCKIAAEAY